MGALKNNPLFNVNQKAIKVSPFWRFFLREVINELRKDFFSLVKKNVAIEFIERRDIEFDTLDYLDNNSYLGCIVDDTRQIPLFFHMPSKDANSLINLLHGNIDVINFDRELSHLNKKVLDQFLERISKTLNKVIQEKSHNLNYSYTEKLFNQKYYGAELVIQIDFIKFNVFIPLEFFKFQSIE